MHDSIPRHLDQSCLGGCFRVAHRERVMTSDPGSPSFAADSDARDAAASRPTEMQKRLLLHHYGPTPLVPDPGDSRSGFCKDGLTDRLWMMVQYVR